MSKRGICGAVVAGLIFSLAADAYAQGNRTGFSFKKRLRERALEEAQKRLEDAKSREAAEEALRRAEELARSEKAKELETLAKEAAARAELEPKEKEAAAAASRMIEEAVKNVSEEASQIIEAEDKFADLEQIASAAVPAPSRSPQVATPGPVAKRKPGAAPEGALPGDEFPDPVVLVKPQPVLPPPLPITPKTEEYTRIDAKGGAFFHASEKIIVFKDDVSVDHKIFDLKCDQLEVFLYKDVKIGSRSLGEKEEEAESVSAADPDDNRRTDIMKAIATGYVVITKASPAGMPQVGKCRYAIYEDTTGDLTMRGMPQVQRGADLIIATDETTRIVFRRSGNMEVHGPHRTEIVKEALSQADR